MKIPVLKVRDNIGNSRIIPAIRGMSAYQVAVANGFKGTEKEWLASLQAEPINEVDKAEIVETVLNALPTWSGGNY
jgi:hypothetical protein